MTFDSDPTPGRVEAVVAWTENLRAHAERYKTRGNAANEALAQLGERQWSGLAADAFRRRLRTVRDGAQTASTRHGEAGDAAQSWAEAMHATQYDAHRALLAAEEAQNDIAVAEAAMRALTGDHAALLDAVAALESGSAGSSVPAGAELYAARQRAEEAREDLLLAGRRLEDAQQRLEDARALGRRAKEQYDRAEADLARRLEAAHRGALPGSTTAELTSFRSGVGKLGAIDVSGKSVATANMNLLRRLTPDEVKVVLAGNPALQRRFWDNPPDPEAVAGWWNGLTAETRATLLRTAPGVFGNLPGLPYADRDTANRISLAKALKNANLTDDQKAVLAQMERAFEAPADNVPVQLVAFNLFMSPPRVAVGYGDLDACDNTTWCASGMMSGAKDSLNGWSDAAKNLWNAQNSLNVERPGVIAFLEYDNPDPVGVNFSDSAKSGAPRFAAELDGNAATRAVFGPGRTPITVTAHSYGTTMASIALTLTKTRIDTFVMVASAGIDTSLVPSLSVLHADHIYTTAATPDRLAPLGAFVSGRAEPNPTVADPRGISLGGAESFSSDGDGQDLEPVDGHDAIGKTGATSNSGPWTFNTVPSEGHGYFDLRTQSLRNIAATTTGQPDQVSGRLTHTTALADQHNKDAARYATQFAVTP
ncbi:alpha/beta hydrolase [Leifsonia sp. NPDC056824]|uniref:alpha/beta hydrolase n=1 Tax=Leifsonia sp. NPDC056824 TaxID=3345953 RepID=UPI003687284C